MAFFSDFSIFCGALILRQHLFEELPGKALIARRHVFGRAAGDHSAAAVAPFGTEVYDPVRHLDDV